MSDENEWEPKEPRAFRRARAKGYYTFLSSHTTLTYRDESDTQATRLVDRVTFCEDFVEVLKRGEIVKAPSIASRAPQELRLPSSP